MFYNQSYMDKRTATSKSNYESNGETYLTSDGQEKVEVVEFRKYSDVTARIVGTDFTVNTTMGAVKKGIKNPFANNSPIAFATPAAAAIGCIYRTNEGYHIQIHGYNGYKEVYYHFLDSEYPCEGITTIQNIKKGEVRNPFRPNKFGGYLGLNEIYRTDNYKWLYTIWQNMIIRGDEKNKEYYNKYRPDTNIYNNTMLDPEWLNYSNYAEWYMNNYNSRNHSVVSEYVVDKDLLYRYYAKYTDGKKCYGPNCCEMIPKDLNNKLGSDYIIPRIMDVNRTIAPLPDSHPIKKIAKFYLENNCITEQAYNAIMNL